MKRLEGLFMAYYCPPPNASQEEVTRRLIETIQHFNARHGTLPSVLGLSERTPETLRQKMVEAGQRLSLNVVTASHIEALTYWLGPVEGGQQ